MKARIEKTSIRRNSKDKPPFKGATWDDVGKYWWVEVKTIDDLLKFSHEIVLSSAMKDDPYDICIEIYDDYRE